METAESKKGSLEDLSKEDLIKKCKNLISLAQKAKFSKEALQQENSNLMKQLNESRNNNVSNQLLEKLTEEKLTLVTKIEDLKIKNVQLERKIEQYEQESCAFHDRIVLLETENTSFTRQVKRLTDENEQLISDLSALEEQIVQLQELGTEQKEQLLKLESSSKNSLDEIEKLTNNIKTKDERIIELSQELQALKIISNASASNKECDKYIKEINQLNNKNEKLTKQFANIENTNEKLKEKVTLYHTKLKKFALTSKQIKEEKNHILSMFKAYTDQIIEWKEQLHTASTQLIKSVKKLQDENDTLKKKLYRFEQVNQDLILREESSLGEIHRLNDILNHSIKREEGCKEECQRLYIKLEQLTKEYEELKIQMDKQISCKENYDLLKEEIALKDKIIEEHKNNADSWITFKEEINQLNEALKQSCEEAALLTLKNNQINEELHKIKNICTESERVSKETINKLHEELSKCKEDIVFLELKSIKEHEMDKDEISRLNEALKQYEHSNEEVLRLTQKNKELESELTTIKNRHITTESTLREYEELVRVNNKLNEELSKCKEDIVSLELRSIKEHENDKQEINRVKEALKQYEHSNEELLRLTHKNEELESELATIKNMHIATESISRDNEELVIINSKLQEELSKCKEDMVSLELKSKKEHEKDKEEISRLNEAFKQYEHSNEEVLRLIHKNEELESELATIKNLHIATESISGENKEIVTINNKLQEELSQCKEDIVSLELKSKKEHEKDKEEISRLNEALKQYEQSNKEVSRLTLKNEELESEIATIKNKHSATESTSKENEELVAINNKLREEIASLKKEIERTVDQMKQSASESEKKYTTYKEEIDKLNEALKVSNIFQQKDKLKENCSQFDHAENSLGNDKETPETRDEQLCKCKEQIDLLEEAIINKESLIEQLKKYENTDHLLAPYKEEINKLNAALKQSDNMEKQFAEKSSEVIVQLSQSNKELENECSRVTDELNLIRNNSNSQSFSQTDDHSLSGEEIDLKRENAELLREMNQMNQALKERGEIISKLEAHCEEVKKKLQLYESQASKNVDTISEKEETIKTLTEGLNTLRNDERSKEEEIANLKAEIEALKDKFNNMDMNYAESDVMSSSTISRCEEVNRLKDLEGPWEERYGKLRTLAIKLKAKIREQTNTVTSLEKEREELLKKHSNSLKTIQTLQTQIDNLQDNLDKVSAENQQYSTKLNSVAESISKDKQQLVSNEEIISKLNKEVEKLNNDKKSVENWKKQVSAKVQTLRKELEAKNLLIKEAESKISKLEDELEDKSKQLKVEQESHKQTRTALDQLGSECKKNSVLNLEMQDYERSVKELSQKIDKQKTEINNLQTQLDMQKNTVNALREQNKTLEERIQDQEKIGNSSSLEVNACKKTIMNLEDQLQHKEEKVSDLTKLLETARFENEELSTELTKVIAEHQKSLGTVKAEREQLRTQVLTLQQTLRDTQDVLKLRDDELSVLKDDYETYKVRAQSVLKKNQNRDLGLEEKLNEELATVKSQNAKLSSELEEISKKLENERTKGETLSREREALTRKLEELESEVNELTNYSEQLGLMHQKAINEHVETVRNLKVHAETLSQCYRQQLSEQEARHNREIIELQSRIDKAPSPVETAPVHPSMPREEGEGSESVESNPPPSVHPIPLERLLDSKSDDEVVRLRKQLSEQESKVVHLTALLSDTEQDFAKHVQMNKVLKEEIRRQQRSVEREKHAENLEYLKNVVFKFVTLNSGDERTRLVPVLNTILKLSPEETQKLTMVAKGDPGTKGWSSYLPMWPSPSKPQ